MPEKRTFWDRPKLAEFALWQLDTWDRRLGLSLLVSRYFGAEISAPKCQVGKGSFGTIPTFFISRAGADKRWAEVIAGAVKAAGHEAIHQTGTSGSEPASSRA